MIPRFSHTVVKGGVKVSHRGGGKGDHFFPYQGIVFVFGAAEGYQRLRLVRHRHFGTKLVAIHSVKTVVTPNPESGEIIKCQ
jgi:hypothetical protein